MNRKKILIVDDDRELVLGLAVRLKSRGYRVVCATDGVTGLGVAQKECPDLVLLDLGLPAGHGLKVMQHMRSLVNTAGVPIVVLSAQDPSVVAKLTLRAGAQAFLHKSVDNDTLLATIQETLGETIAAERLGV